jgi:hypothetical protein
MRALGYALIGAACCWIVSEILELGSGGRTGLTLLLTAAFHLLMVAGIWGAWAGQRGGGDLLSRLGAGMASLGYLILVYPPVAVALGSSVTAAGYVEYLGSNPLFRLAGILVTVGLPLFGIAILRAGSYPLWIGLVLLVSPPVFAATALSGGPEIVSLIANMLAGLAFLAMGSAVLRAHPPEGQ